jgi:hypothetical protein
MGQTPVPASFSYRNLILVALGLPTAIFVADQAILNFWDAARISPLALAVLLAFFVLQMALVGWSAGRFVEPWPMRWVLWLWIMAIIDLQFLAFPEDWILQALLTGILAGQLGSMVVWGLLAGGPSRWRVPGLIVTLVVGGQFCFLMLRIADGQHTLQFNYFNWGDFVTLETTMLAAVCLIIRLSGFSLDLVTDASVNQRDSELATQRLQFGIRHVLIATTTLAAALGLAKAGNMLTTQFGQRLYDESFLFLAIVAAGTASVLIVALWAALGRGNALLRCLLAMLIPLLIGSAIGVYCVKVGQPQFLRFNPRYWMYMWYRVGYWWIAFMVLTALLLAASLIIFRTLGYRLTLMAARPKAVAARSLPRDASHVS